MRIPPEGVSPDASKIRSAACRRESTEQALARLPKDKHAEFVRIVSEMDGYVGIREDRAYWQMVLTGETRGLLLREGATLAQSGRLEWKGWCQVAPPAVIGTLGATPVADPAHNELRGAPASRGQVTGPARII